jgi:hypothetical protein
VSDINTMPAVKVKKSYFNTRSNSNKTDYNENVESA